MNIKGDKGSITVFVLVGLTFMSAFLLISFGNNINKSKVVKEQENMIRGIYSYNDGNVNAYNRAYDDIRTKNKQIFTKTVSYTDTITLTKTFPVNLSGYKIYGSTSGVGTYDSTSTSPNGKYKIRVVVTDSKGTSKTHNIYISSPLKKSGSLVDYIDYKNQKVVRRVNSTKEEAVSLPAISSCEEYTKIQVVGGTPSKIEIKYTGYKLNS